MKAPRLRASALGFVTLLLVAGFPVAGAVLPTNEVNDVLWCVDQTSRTVQNAVSTYAAWLADTYDANYRAIKCKLHQRPPIAIDGDALPVETYGPEHGVVRGSGTQWDPYVIENWEIVGSVVAEVHSPDGSSTRTPEVPIASLGYGRGISIENTQKHFVIRKVYVHGFAQGIHVSHAPHVRIEDNVLEDNARGIRVEDAPIHIVQVLRNHVASRDQGIEVLRAARPKVLDNVVEVSGGGWSQRHGIYVAHKYTGDSPAEVGGNSVTSGDTGIGIVDMHWAWFYDNRVCAPRPFRVVTSSAIADWNNGC